jgi:hypothetical protein
VQRLAQRRRPAVGEEDPVGGGQPGCAAVTGHGSSGRHDRAAVGRLRQAGADAGKHHRDREDGDT